MQPWSGEEKTAALQAIGRASSYVHGLPAGTASFRFDSRAGQHPSDTSAYFTIRTVHANSLLKPALQMAVDKLLHLVSINGGIDAWIYLSALNVPHPKEKWVSMELRHKDQDDSVARRDGSWGGLQRAKRDNDQKPSVISSLLPIASGSAAL